MRRSWGSRAAYGGAIASVAIASLITLLIRDWMGSSVSLLFFPAVILAAMYGGYGPSLLATVLSTASLAYLFVPPYNSFDIGSDDYIRLAVFAGVAVATASLSSKRHRAEASQRDSLRELQATLDTLRKVSGWPVLVGEKVDRGARRILDHAAHVVACGRVVAMWEADDEPWVYVTSNSDETVTKHPPAERPALRTELEAATDLSASFHVEHLEGRVFFGGVPAGTSDATPLAALVAREIGNSLEQLYVTERLRHIAVREDRIRVARDLHDGVLQGLTGIRFQLQAAADDQSAPHDLSERLLALERAIAVEQRELRLFIDDLRPAQRTSGIDGTVGQHLDELRERLGIEWKTPIVVRVQPADMTLAADKDQAVRLMVREAVVNALKHAQPTRITVDVEGHGAETVRIVVGDDGRGFGFRGRRDHDELVATNTGPASLRERVVSLGGRLSIESAPTGTRLEIVLPLGAPTAAAAK